MSTAHAKDDHTATISAINNQVRSWIRDTAAEPRDKEAELLANILSDPAGLDFTVGFVDRVVRPEDAAAAAEHLRWLGSNPPSFLSAPLQAALTAGSAASRLAPGPVVSTAQATMRAMVSHLVLDARKKQLSKAIARLKAGGRRLNINLLGEAVLGEGEASRRIEGVRELIERDDVDYCSIKVSAVVDHINLWAASDTAEAIVERLLPLYELAAAQPSPTFINLDMEEFHDLELTVDVFEKLLSYPELHNLYAGIVLQAYLPDAQRMMERVRAFAAERVKSGGAPVKVRLVKGANLPMERIDASLHGWPLATWGSKEESDAHYKRVLRDSLTLENLQYVHLGIAGHNLFDVAHAWHVMQERNIPAAHADDAAPLVEFEMLAGMATAQATVISRDVGPMRLYVPVVKPAEFDVAVSYLVRRLEENASQENFMSALATISENEEMFTRESERFRAAYERALTPAENSSMRIQDREAENTAHVALGGSVIPAIPGKFKNTPDTDVSLRANQVWAEAIRSRITSSTLGQDQADAARLTTEAELEHVVSQALAAQAAWAERSVNDRASLLRSAAQLLALHRAHLIEVAAAETGKLLEQADPEVSEAIDFALYYADSMEKLASLEGVAFSARKLTLVTPPWNFPIAIPCGSMLSALVTGSAVVVKPAPQARRTGAYLVSLLHQAGIPEDVLRLVDVEENELGEALISDRRFDQIILTGAYETAKLFASFNPQAAIKAETSGKNSIIVTPHADLDLAVKDVVNSAFGHAGQKCSAASLVITVGSVTRSRRFNTQLADAVRSLHVGRPTDALATMGPIVEAPGEKLKRGLNRLGEGERWLQEPRDLDGQGTLFSPGVRGGVAEGSEFHLTEYFGPILGIVHADTLDDAIRIQNGTEYGLTAGLHSLDKHEITQWLDKVQAGNIYVNRSITGAIVERQPFGGWKKSAIGKTAKAGGPNYLVHLMHAEDSPELAALSGEAWLDAARGSDHRAINEFFAPKDVQMLHGEINALRYKPTSVLVRASSDATEAQVLRVLNAAWAAGASPTLSLSPELPSTLLTAILEAKQPATELISIRESISDLAKRVPTLNEARIRVIGTVEDELAAVLAQHPEVALFDGPVLAEGRVEILPFVLEQAVSITNHRYGNPLPYNLREVLNEQWTPPRP